MEIVEETVDNVALKEVAIVKRSAMPEVVAREYAFTPESAKQLLLTAPVQKPPLMIEDAQKENAVYDMGAEYAGKVSVDLLLKSVSEDGSVTNGFDIRVPLRMLPYRTPEDPSMCFDLNACHKVDEANATIEKHNKYITSLLSLFIFENGCGTSANHVTLPSPPDVLAITRQKERIAFLLEILPFWALATFTN